jgi:hypothetical protein
MKLVGSNPVISVKTTCFLDFFYGFFFMCPFNKNLFSAILIFFKCGKIRGIFFLKNKNDGIIKIKT